MDVLVTGATGYIGSAVCEALQKAGYRVTGLARTREKAEALEKQGIRGVVGNLLEPEALAAAARAADAVIHTANTNDAHAAEADRAAVHAMLKALEGSGKTFVYTSGIWVLGSTGNRIADENTPTHPAALVAHRPGLEQEVLDYAKRGVRAIVIRPAAVYGRAGGGLFTMLTQSARQSGAARYVGDGRSRWALVDVDDLADLYVLALEKAKPASLYMAAQGPSYTIREIAEAASIGAGAQGKTQAWPLEDARKTLGLFADALTLDQQVSGAKAERELGWAPRRPSAIEDLRSGSYAR